MWKRAKIDVRLESDTAPALTFHVNCAGPKEDQEVAEYLAGQIALALSRIVSPYTASEKASLKKELDELHAAELHSLREELKADLTKEKEKRAPTAPTQGPKPKRAKKNSRK